MKHVKNPMDPTHPHKPITVIDHRPSVIERAQLWMTQHAAANTPTPNETYLLVRDLLMALHPTQAPKKETS